MEYLTTKELVQNKLIILYDKYNPIFAIMRDSNKDGRWSLFECRDNDGASPALFTSAWRVDIYSWMEHNMAILVTT